MERIPTLEPVKAPDYREPAMPAVLESRISKYEKMFDNIMREPSYKRRNMKLVVATDNAPRSKEVVRDVEDYNHKASEKELF